MPGAANDFPEATVADTTWIGIVTLMTFVYLTYALLAPEKF